VYYTVIKHSGHLRTLEKCRKHWPAARLFYISLVFSNARRVLSQCNTRLRLLYLLNIRFKCGARCVLMRAEIGSRVQSRVQLFSTKQMGNGNIANQIHGFTIVPRMRGNHFRPYISILACAIEQVQHNNENSATVHISVKINHISQF